MAVSIFDANFYRTNNQDLAGLNDAQALQHLLDFGLNEGRKFSSYVDLNLYRSSNPDLAAAGLTTSRQLYDHLANFGVAEGRRFSAVFDTNFYRNANADLAAAALNNEQLFDHFRTLGVNERRGAVPQSAAIAPSAAPTSRLAADLSTSTTPIIAPASSFAPPPSFPPDTASPPGPLPVPPSSNSEPFSFAPVERDTGNSLNSSLNVSVNNLNVTFNEVVGSSDPNDFYRFVLSSTSNVNVSLAGSSLAVQISRDTNNNDAIEVEEVFLAGANGLSGSSNFGGPTTSFNGSLTDGTYYVRVFSSGSDTNYQLTLSAFGNFIPPQTLI